MLQTLRDLILPRLDARHVDDLECAASVMVAIGLAHAIGAETVSWAAFSGYMVMRGHVGDSLFRGVLRIVGTGLGAGLALLAVPLIHTAPGLCALAAAVVGGGSLYAALTAGRAYAWLFAGLTFVMILLDSIEHPAHAIAAFATMRLLEVGGPARRGRPYDTGRAGPPGAAGVGSRARRR